MFIYLELKFAKVLLNYYNYYYCYYYYYYSFFCLIETTFFVFLSSLSYINSIATRKLNEFVLLNPAITANIFILIEYATRN